MIVCTRDTNQYVAEQYTLGVLKLGLDFWPRNRDLYEIGYTYESQF